MVLKGAIFDLDGVIVNTINLHFKAWQKMFCEYGEKFDFTDYKAKVDGIPRIAGAKAILKNLTDKEIEEAAARKQKYFLEFLDNQEETIVYQDTLDLIEKLKNKGVKIAVISSSKSCRYILDKAGLTAKFEVILGGGDVKNGKPHPDIFLIAAKQLGLKPAECIVFEDAVLGVVAAKRAGIKCVGIDRHGDESRLAEADMVVSNLKSVDICELERLIS